MQGSLFCYADLGPWMRTRNFLFITMLVLCHLIVRAQTLTNVAPPAENEAVNPAEPAANNPSQNSSKTDSAVDSSSSLPNDPGQEILPLAQPEQVPHAGVPVEWEAQSQSRMGNIWTLTGAVVVHYRDYILKADKVTYDQSTTQMEAEGNLQVAGGPNDVLIFADHGDMRLNLHTARYFGVHGSQGVRTEGRTSVYSTTNPFFFTGRVMLENGEGHYQIIDGTMTNCRLPRPDWQLYARSIKLEDGKASTANALFKFLGVPIFYLPYLRHPIDDTGRESGFLIPVVSTGSSIKGYTFGEQVYWAINRNMDILLGMEYYSKRGWAPNGDFRYKGRGLDHMAVRWNALLDRGVEETTTSTTTTPVTTTTSLVDQGGVDINALGSRFLTPETRAAGNVEYLSSYLYRLVFNDNFWLAVSSEVHSDISLTHAHNGFVPSVSMERFQTFAGNTDNTETTLNSNQARILHLPNLRFDVLDRPLSSSGLYWGMGSSLGYLNRSEHRFTARNVVRADIYPHLFLPFTAGGWSGSAEVAVRETAYTLSQIPNRTVTRNHTPTLSHDPLNRSDFEASVDLRAPAVERDFPLTRWNRELRHVIEPEITYRYVTGIGTQAQNVLLIDSTDIATNTNDLGYSLTQRFYLRPTNKLPCVNEASENATCPQPAREWASWQITQKFFIDPDFGGAVIANRRNVFDSTLDLSGIAFLTSPRNLGPIISRLRFEAINNLRVEWDMDYDAKAGQLGANNLYAGYSWGRTTLGVGHALLNDVEYNNTGTDTTSVKSQQVQPFLSIGKASGKGFNMAANMGYDYVLNTVQYAGAQAVYNWDCCGLSVGYRHFNLGSVRDETQWLYSFTLANFGSVGDIRHSNTAFRDPTLPPAY
jgi:LPS-assembly protein